MTPGVLQKIIMANSNLQTLEANFYTKVTVEDIQNLDISNLLQLRKCKISVVDFKRDDPFNFNQRVVHAITSVKFSNDQVSLLDVKLEGLCLCS